MRLLIVNTVPTDRNGITNVIFNLLSAMDLNGIDVGYVSISEPSEIYRQHLAEKGVELYIIPRKLSSPIKYIRKLAKIARGYDIMHVHGNSATLVLEMISAKIAGCKKRIAHSHNTQCTYRGIDRLCRPLFYSLCNGRLACGEDAGRWLFGTRDFTVINNGISTVKFAFDVAKRNEIRQKLGWDECHIIGNVGNFVEQKNHRFILDVFAKLLRRDSSARLLLLGDGSLMGEIKTKAEKLKISDKIYFAGAVDNAEDYMAAMDIVLMPSLHEGLPLTLIEEQANGLHCFCSDAITSEANMSGNISFISLKSPIDKWVENIENGLLLKFNREIESSNAISQIVAHKYDIAESSRKILKCYLQI